jgi:hypothetical protein
LIRNERYLFECTRIGMMMRWKQHSFTRWLTLSNLEKGIGPLGGGDEPTEGSRCAYLPPRLYS